MNTDTLLDNLNQDLSREYAHWHFYMQAAANVTGLQRHELREFFLDAAKDEAEHVHAFSRVIVGLGGIPGTAVAPFASTLTNPDDLLKEALAMEEEVVQQFVTRLGDCEEMLRYKSYNDMADIVYLRIFLEGQLEDSRGDVYELRQMLRK